ncbi:arginase [Gallibacterium salpingitidis]|uniref:Arginase n=1 Tax=Gallibacterium salpingitidis TaxID=505341 RepID=A0AB36E2Q5_9PAST|nr:arginase [Gallibacterium salpingitidis]OBX06091.1 arginase [Gallibacterium salpingitidis]OBX10526.1 arginase [Gallibacterium salpingitidis]WKS99929.1 arginase [Gallibacterium salpingitidis]
MRRKVSLIGVPTDVGAGHRGSSMGPEALRVAGITEMLEGMGLDVYDQGNLHGPANPCHAAINGYRNFAEVITWNQLTHDAIYQELGRGHMPIMLGGDHCLAAGSISAVARYCREQGKELRVIWLDAHTDFNTAEITPSGNMHGMPVACLFGHGPLELVNLSGHVPTLEAHNIRQIGIRSVDDEEKHFIHEAGIQIFDMRHIDEIGMRHVMEKALTDLHDNVHLHVSFDVDFLDPEIAPGVGTTVRGGVNYREAQLCMEMIADTGLMESLDIVELNPALDVRNLTANIAVELVQSLFGKNTLIR